MDTDRGPLDPSWNVFIVFSYLLNFCSQWHLCKFLNLEDLINHLFGLVFPCPISKKMRVGICWSAPSVVLRCDVLQFCFSENSEKILLWHFLYIFVFTQPQATFRQLGFSFLGWNLNKCDKLGIYSYYFMLKDHQKSYVVTRYKGNFISLFSSIH